MAWLGEGQISGVTKMARLGREKVSPLWCILIGEKKLAGRNSGSEKVMEANFPGNGG